MLDDDNKTVLAAFPPLISYADLVNESQGKSLIYMHKDNSPAWLTGTYVKGKFYKPEGVN